MLCCFFLFFFSLCVCFSVNDLASRTFGIWTLLTCCLCWICALHVEERGVYLATLVSFFIALGYFIVELLIYGTQKPKNIVPMAVIAGGSIVWMLSAGIPPARLHH